jgi:hypothetical protein
MGILPVTQCSNIASLTVPTNPTGPLAEEVVYN